MKAASYLQIRKLDRNTHETPTPTAVMRTGLITAPATTGGLVVFPTQDRAWVESNKYILISSGLCSRTILNGVCDRDPGACPFKHELPDQIDTSSEEWKRAEIKSAEYKARRKRRDAAVMAPALALPEPTAPPVPPPPTEPPGPLHQPHVAMEAIARASLLMAADTWEEVQDAIDLRELEQAHPSEASNLEIRYDENDDELPPALYQPQPNFRSSATAASYAAVVARSELPPGKMYSYLTGEVIDEDWDDGSYDWDEDADNIYARRL